jgi:hypothetical protein
MADDGPRHARLAVAIAVCAALALVVGGMFVLDHAQHTRQAASPSRPVIPDWAAEQGFEHDRVAVAGARLYAESGCANCHTYLGSGSSSLGGPDLSAIGATDRGAAYFAAYVADPSRFGNAVMPAYGQRPAEGSAHGSWRRSARSWLRRTARSDRPRGPGDAST